MNALIIVHVSCEGPGLFAPLLEHHDVRLKVVDIEQGHALPDRLDDTQIVIVMGGPMNVGEEAEHPYLEKEYDLLRQALEDDVPVLGVCLGSQILAHAAGARVYRGPVEEFGWSRVDLTRAGRRDPLFEGVDRSMLVFQWHAFTFDIPTAGELLATGSEVPSQAFRVGRRAYGLQFHIELDRRLLELWMALAPEERRDLTPPRVAAIRQCFEAHERWINRQAAAIADNFYRLARFG